jgi:hypothetical protein
MIARTKIRGVILVGAALGAIFCVGASAGAAQAQAASSGADNARITSSSVGFAGPRTVTGAPYSSVMEERHTQTLANGTNIDLVTAVTKQYRDAQGRTRMEHYTVRDGQTSETPILIEIVDPAAGVRYMLNPKLQKAQSYPLAEGRGKGVVTSSDSTAPVPVAAPTVRTGDGARPEVTHASLGTDSMLGVEVTGSRQTWTYPVGSRGNDQPITVVIETWRSNDLRFDMLRKQDDPRTGVVEWRVTQIDRVEPDASLFQVPPDYTIENRQ